MHFDIVRSSCWIVGDRQSAIALVQFVQHWPWKMTNELVGRRERLLDEIDPALENTSRLTVL